MLLTIEKEEEKRREEKRRNEKKRKEKRRNEKKREEKRREEKRRNEKKRVKQRNTGFQRIKGEMTLLDLVDMEEGETFLLSLFPVVYLTTRIS